MTLECIVAASDELTVGKRYEILNVNNGHLLNQNWFLLVNDNGEESKYLSFRFSDPLIEIRDEKLKLLLEQR
jgi:hypothetical protein